MSRDTDNTFFILSPLANKHAGLYQQLLSGIVGYQELGNRIINKIKVAHAFREIEQVRELSRILINIPIKEFQLIAQYYLVWCKCREFEYPAITLERIIEQTQTYKTKALFSRAAIEGFQGDVTAAIYFYNEALKTSPTISEYVDSVRSIAVLKSVEGFHKSALRDLEALEPLIQHVEPRLYYDFLNSYAIELAEAGRKQEARNISRHVLSSPFIYAYPEWQETARELREPDRSFVTINAPQKLRPNVVHMPEVEHGKSEQIRYNQPARVTDLQAWKTKMGKDDKPEEELNPKQMIFRIIDFYVHKDTTDEQRYELWEAFQKVINPPKPDDSEGA